MRITEPRQLIGAFYERHRRLLQVFFITYGAGLLIHMYMYTNKLFNYFELGNIFADMSFTQGDTIAQGRWFLPIATNLFTSYSMPMVNGLLSLFYVAASAVMVVDLLKIRSRLYGALYGCAFAAFPGYACVLAYGVNADAIAMGVFLCMLGIYLYEKYPYGWIFAVLLIGCGLGAYQTYLSVSIGMIYMLLFFQAYEERLEWKSFALRIGKAIGVLAGGFAFYYGMLHVSMAATGVTLTDYHGVDSMTSFTLKGIAKGLVYAYGYFLSYFFSDRYVYTIGNRLFSLLGAVVLLVLAGKRLALWKREKQWLSLLALSALTALLPLGLNATPFLMADRVGAGVDRYMIFSIMFVWAMLAKLLDNMDGERIFSKASYGASLRWLGVLSLLAACIGSAVICNQSYHRMEAATAATTSYLNRIAGRLEEMPQWQQGMPVYFANTKAFMSDTYAVELPAYEALTNMPGTELSPHYNERGIAKYFRTYLHFPIVDAGEEKKAAIEAGEAFREMPAYPANGSIAVIDDVIVVKLCESEDEE